MRWFIYISLPLSVMSAYTKGVSFYGMETEQRKFVCSDVQPPDYYLHILKDLDFDSVRIPFSTIFVEEGKWGDMDLFMEKTMELNMSVYLDHHRTFPNRQQEHPYVDGITRERFINAWFTILDRYEKYPHLIGVNAWNEFVSHDPQVVNDVTSDIFRTIEEKYPNRFNFYATGILWSGKLQDVNLDYLPFKDRIKYSLHKYVFSIGANENYETSWYESLGGHPADRVVIGEYGWLDQDAWWANRFVDWLRANNISDTFFWTIARSDGTGGLWRDDCREFIWDKYRILKRLWYGPRLRVKK